MPRAASLLLLAASAHARPKSHLDRYIGLESERSKQPFHFQHHNTETVPHPYYGTVQKSTFRSPAINLMNGEAWFTLPTVNRMPFPSPGVPYAMVHMEPDMIDDTGRRPPVSELYGHHWLMYDKLVGGSGDNLGCGGEDTFVSNIFGSGAEMRGTCGCDIPDGYGLYSTEGQGWYSANIHMINTLDLSPEHFQDQPDPQGAATKACIECNYSPGNTGVACKKGAVGDFACCVDLGRCHVNNRLNVTKTTYYLQYNISWITDLTKVKPLQYGVIDTFTCGSLGNVRQNMHTKSHNCDDKVCIAEVEREIDKDGEIIWMYGHQHVGAINGSLYHNGKYVCTSKPYYGTDPTNPLHNEKGYITRFDVCLHSSGRQGAASNKTLRVKKGDKLRVESIYNVAEVDERILPMPGGGMHGGVMGLFYFFISEDSYKCERNQCVPVTKNGVDLATCQQKCTGPAPPAPSKYACYNGQCTLQAQGVDIDTCKSACS